MAFGNTREIYEAICREVSKDPGSSANGHCPSHHDSTGSLSVSLSKDGKILLKCFAGCLTQDIVRELGFEMSDLFPEDRPAAKGKKKPHEKANLSVEQLAAAKKIPLEFLQKLGLKTVEDEYWGKYVEIPYYGIGGQKLPLTRRRLGLKGRESNWGKGNQSSIYGQQFMARIRELEYVILVEGESDCWTLWHHKYPALGIPGASNAQKLRPEHVEGVRTVYVYVEPDKGGATFAHEVPLRLKELGYTGDIYRVFLQGYKDPNELHKAVSAEQFKEIFQVALDARKPASIEDLKKKCQPVRGTALTDLGNAERLAIAHGQDLRFCRDWNKWLVWDGNRWAVDRENQVQQMAKDTVRRIYLEAVECNDSDQRKKIAEHAESSEREPAIRALITLAQGELPILPERLDADPWMLTVRNGTVDLRTGKLLPARREDYITKTAAVRYDSEARCPTFMQFINKILLGNENLISFVQRAVGYSLTGKVTERCLFILHGIGRNGKSTLLEVLQAMLDEYALRTPTETLMVRYGGSEIPNDIARLKGARFVSASESEEGQRLAEAKIKDLTGGDTVSARFMRGEFFDFRPEFKLWLATNHRPVIRGTDNAIWDRIRLIPFEYRVPEEEQDPDLPEKLKAELDGIFQWALEGCLAWLTNGLGKPAEIVQAVSEYRGEMDVLGQFLDDCCELEPYLETPVKDLYQEYRKWCEINAEKMISRKRFSQRLLERGLEPTRDKTTRYFRGIGIRADGDRFEEMTDGDTNSDISAIHARVRETNPKTASPSVTCHPKKTNGGQSIPDLSAYD